MTDKKISELTNITGANVNDTADELPIVDASTNTTNAITRAELFKSVAEATITGDLTVDTNTLFVDASINRVGIGTTNPSEKLEVNGDAKINDITVGRGAGDASNNTALGFAALNSNTTGGINTAVGRVALNSNTTGNSNTALGFAALESNTTGSNNTAVGRVALNSNTTGSNNTALGFSALESNTTGGINTALGFEALESNTTGSNNTAVGRVALNSNTTGDSNTAFGFSALEDVTTGGGNIGIGFRNHTNTYAPVFNPTTQNNRLVMGHTDITNAYVQVAWTVVSDARDKTAFAPVPHGLDFVNSLKPTQYQFKEGGRYGEADGIKRYGFLAQDILELEGDDPVLVDAEDSDKLKLKESNLIPVLVNAIQELSAEVQTLKAQIEAK